MRKKLFSILVVMSILLLGSVTVSNAENILKNSAREKPRITNKMITLGSASIFGDGIEGNEIVEAVTEKFAFLRMESNTQTFDFNMTYSIDCDGDDDIGIIIFMVQCGGVTLDEKTVISTGNESGELKIENKIINNNEIFSYQILAIYLNTDPNFNNMKMDAGAAMTTTPRTIQNKIHDHPLINLLLSLTRFSRLFT